jgi:hypothetical protein
MREQLKTQAASVEDRAQSAMREQLKTQAASVEDRAQSAMREQLKTQAASVEDRAFKSAMREQLEAQLRASRYGAAASVAISGDGREARSAGQQSVEVEYAGCGEKDRHGTQHDGQDQIEQKDSERNEEAELEGCACANLYLLRCCDAVGIAHVPTLPSRPLGARCAAPTGVDHLCSGRWRIGGSVCAVRPCGSVPTAPNDHDLCEGSLSRGPW